MKNEKAILNKIEQKFLNTIYAFLNTPISFYRERDIECYMYSQLSKIRYISEKLFPVNINGKKWKDVLLHSQANKFRKEYTKENKEKELNGYFDIAIEDNQKMDSKDIELFLAIELKYNHDLNDQYVRKDILNLINPKNKLKYGFMFNFSCFKDVSVSKKQLNNFKKDLEKELKRINSKTKVYYCFAYVNYSNPKEKGVVLFKIDKNGVTLLKDKKIIGEINLNSLGFSSIQ